MSSPKGEVSPDVRNYFSPNTSSVLDVVSHRLHQLPLSSHSLKRQPSTDGPEPRNKIAKMGDVNMLDNLHKHLVSIASSTYSVLGWAAEHIKFNQTDEVVRYIEKNDADSVAVVILASDFHVRTEGPAAIKEIFDNHHLHHVPDSRDIDIIPPIPKVDQANPNRLPLVMPWAHIAKKCPAAFREYIQKNPIFHGRYLGTPISFYCVPAAPEAPPLVLVYSGISNNAPFVTIRDAFLATLKRDAQVCALVGACHGNIQDTDDAELILDGPSPHTCHRHPRPHHPASIRSVPSSQPAARTPLMSPAFSFHVPMRGVGTPWLGPNTAFPKLVACKECYSSAHYLEDCPIVKSPEYRAAHGLADEPGDDNSPDAPSSLTISLDAPTPANGAGGNGFNNNRGRGNGGFSHGNRAGGSYGRYGGNNRGNGNGRRGGRFAFD
ncbi:hypothetical protein R3P38DRAFT_3569834 [Favolaschia claudopus]|uniref:Uncharacterized protein n=1 Tax=Favolaschia claudopus TaxID=2862362 RepID=A0AAW0AU34_9AGAR